MDLVRVARAVVAGAEQPHPAAVRTARSREPGSGPRCDSASGCRGLTVPMTVMQASDRRVQLRSPAIGRWLRVVGPAWIVMLADVDAPSVVTAGEGGTEFRVRAPVPLFAIVPMLFLVQEMTARLALAPARATPSWSGRATGRHGRAFRSSGWRSSISSPTSRSSPVSRWAPRSWASPRPSPSSARSRSTRRWC